MPTIQTKRGPLEVPDWAQKMADATSVDVKPGGPEGEPSFAEMVGAGETFPKRERERPLPPDARLQTPTVATKPVSDVPPAGTANARYHRYKIDGHVIRSDHILTSDEVKAIKEKLTPPLSQHPYLAAATRIAAPIIGGVAGFATPVPGGAAIGAGVGAGVGEAIAEKLEGRKQLNPLEIGVQAGTSAIIPGPGKTILGGIIKSGAHGVVSNTLASWAEGRGTPDVGNNALAFVFGGTLGGIGTKLSTGRSSALKSSLREVLPMDVADGAHEVITQGKLSSVVPKEVQTAVREDLVETNSMLKAAKASKPTVRVRLAPRASEYQFQAPSVQTEAQVSAEDVVGRARPKFKWEKVGKGEYKKVPIVEENPKVAGRIGGDERGVPGIDTEGEGPIHKPDGTIGISRQFTPSIWLFDRMQTRSKLPVYNEAYLPIRSAVESGDRQAIKKAAHDVEQRFLRDKTLAIPDDVRQSVQHLVNRARGVSDGVLQDLEVTLKNIPGARRYVSDSTIRELAANIVTLQYQGTLPGRIGPLLRNAGQSFQTGYMTLGEKYYWKGIQQTFTKEGYQLAERLGFLGPEHTIAAELDQGKSLYSRLMRVGFWPYRKIDDLNNAIMGLGQYHRTLDAARVAKNVEDFIHRAKLDLIFPKAEREMIAELWAKKNFQGAAQRAGLIRANTTQFLYGDIERPQALTGSTLQRVGLGFGNWPLFYANIFKELVFGDTPWQTKALAAARMTAAHWLLGYAAYKMYKGYGYPSQKAHARAMDFVGFGPLFYGGGAALETAKGLEEAARRTYEGEIKPSRALKEAGRALVPLAPGVQQYRDILGTSPVGKYVDPSKEGYAVRIRKTLEDR